MTAIAQMAYRRGDKSPLPVEVLTFRQLRKMNNGGAQRSDFNVVAVIEEGHGSITVDFTDYFLAPKSAVWIAPGSVHRWADIANLTGCLVIFVPTVPVTDATRELVTAPDLVATWPIQQNSWRFVRAALGHLQLETGVAATEQRTEIPEILVSAFIARLAPPRAHVLPDNSTFTLFRSSVEAHFRQHHDVSYYAHALGYVPRTLSRAAQKVTGRTAKAFISDRLILEAKRLLAQDKHTAARCAIELGFIDASNFSLFFLRATGLRPGVWQAQAELH